MIFIVFLRNLQWILTFYRRESVKSNIQILIFVSRYYGVLVPDTYRKLEDQFVHGDLLTFFIDDSLKITLIFLRKFFETLVLQAGYFLDESK